MKKILFSVLLVIGVSFGGYKLWNKYINYNFGVITEGKVYKSAVIAPNKIKDYILKHNIKVVIDLRHTFDKISTIKEEKIEVEKVSGTKYININSPQVPTKKNLQTFYKILDNKKNYPVLIHCYHGLGRTMLYSALYKMEYEKYSNIEAQKVARFIPEFAFYKSSFAKGKSKGDFLLSYVPRSEGKDSTLNTMK